MPFFNVCTKQELPPGSFKTVTLLGKKVAVFNRDGEYYAISAACGHQGADLTRGIRTGDVFTCPRHGWQYNLYTGECLSNGSFSLPRYPLEEVDGTLRVNPTSSESPY